MASEKRWWWGVLPAALFSAGVLASPSTIAATSQGEAAEVWSDPALSLSELLNLNTTAGSLTGTAALKAPVAVTTITAEDIDLSPARTLNDLLEIYVPGLFVLNHNEDFHPEMRGISADRNYKFLLLVNGRNMNQKGHAGATAELGNWDLHDIAQIEVIRGPGSVTYGPGAIMGVISITTKDAWTGANRVSARLIAPYDSAGLSLSTAQRKGLFALYAYASLTKTEGVTPNFYAGDKLDNVGYVGKSFPMNSPYALQTQDYLRDYRARPQIKAHLDLQIGEGWDFWGRFTSSGIPTPRSGAGAASKQIDGAGDLVNYKGFNDSRLTLAGGYQRPLGAMFKLHSTLSWSLEDFDQFESLVDPSVVRSLKNNKSRFSENELAARVLVILRHNDRMNSAVGAEYSHLAFGPGFGSTPDTGFKMGDGSDIVSGPTSQSVGPAGELIGGNGATVPIFAGSGWSTDTYSVLAETNLEFHRLFSVIASGRLDKNTYSKYLASPRLVLMSEITRTSVIKAVAQQSKRMNTAEQLFVQHLNSSKADPETLTAVDLLYSAALRADLAFTANGFYNHLKVIGWNGKNATVPIGTLELYGVEVEAKYSKSGAVLGLNHSTTRQLSWHLAKGQDGSGISYSDFNRTVDATNMVTLQGVGNNLNNVPAGTTKLFANYTHGRLTGHVDGRVFWGWPGMSDGLTALQAAAAGTPKQPAVDTAVAQARAKDVYGVDIRTNASLRVRIMKELSISGYVINLIGNRSNRRYSYDAGINSASPNRIGWVEEPRAFGVELSGSL